MSVEEHHDALIPKVTLAEAIPVKAMNLRIGQDVSNTLQVNYHQVTLSELP